MIDCSALSGLMKGLSGEWSVMIPKLLPLVMGDLHVSEPFLAWLGVSTGLSLGSFLHTHSDSAFLGLLVLVAVVAMGSMPSFCSLRTGEGDLAEDRDLHRSPLTPLSSFSFFTEAFPVNFSTSSSMADTLLLSEGGDEGLLGEWITEPGSVTKALMLLLKAGCMGTL